MVEPGDSIRLGKYLTFTFGNPASDVIGWILPVTVANTEYNSLPASVKLGVQFADGRLSWSERVDTNVLGLDQRVLQPQIPLSPSDYLGRSPPKMLLMHFTAGSTGQQILKLMRLFPEHFPSVPERIAFVNFGTLYVMNTDGSNITEFARGYNPAWSPNGDKIAFVETSQGRSIIYVANADGFGKTRLTDGKNPTWSPDGTKIAFTMPTQGKGEIYVMNVEGSNLVQLTNNPAADSNPCWSPDGSKIAFDSDRSKSGYWYRIDIFVINADGSGKARKIGGAGSYNQEPAWSPDGSKIAFSCGSAGVYVMNADGSGITMLSGGGSPAWSPDGAKIVLQSTPGTLLSDILIMNADGSDIKRLAKGHSPAWAPTFKYGTGATNHESMPTEKQTIKVKREVFGAGKIEVLNLGSEYLPIVVACENPSAPYESLKAQAVAARSFALYKKEIEPRSEDYDILDSEADQVYNPKKFNDLSQSKQEEIKQAVKDTESIVLKYTGKIICAFYVSGIGDTEKYVTYNEGKSGDSITQTSLGLVTSPPSKNPYNRGCMGQVQANELAKNSYGWKEILKYFYGDDIEIEEI